MGIFGDFVVPDFTGYLVAVLALLIVWQYYKLQVMAGRIQAVDFWDRSGIRMFIHSTVQDDYACQACQAANGTVFLPSLSTKKNFTTLERSCENPSGCRCLVIGIYGAWKEAQRLVDYLRKRSKKAPLKLNEKVIAELLAGDWEKTISSGADRISIHMLEAMRMEGSDPDAAIFRYRFVINQASSARDLYLVVPAYLRLVGLLERLRRHEDAIELIQGFEKRYEGKKPVAPFPTEAQRGAMSVHKSRIVMMQRQPVPVAT